MVLSGDSAGREKEDDIEDGNVSDNEGNEEDGSSYRHSQQVCDVWVTGHCYFCGMCTFLCVEPDAK